MGVKPRTNGWAGVAIALAVALPGIGCDDFLDVNLNPNQPQSAQVDVTLPATLANFSNGIIGSWPAKMSAEWTQQISYNRADRGMADYDLYEMRGEDASALWEVVYTRVLNETKNIMNTTEAAEEWAYHGIAKVLHAWTLAVATDVWGPIPHTQALDPDIARPVYDDQRAVYESVQQLLDEAIEELQRPNFPTRLPGTNDLLYGGDLNRWIRLAYTLKAQSHMRMVYAQGENANTRAQLALDALANGFESNLDDAQFVYPTGALSRQPWHIIRSDPAYRVSHFYVELLRSRTDPRLAVTAERTTGDAALTYRGHMNGAPPEADSRFSRVANYFALDTTSFAWASYSNAKFLEAEARLIVSGAAAADAAYREGIRANLQKMRLSTTATNNYVNARANLSTHANPLAEIMREKYIANFLKFEAWVDWRRTGYPVLTPVPNAVISDIPQRFPTAASELRDNQANALATGIPAGLPGMTVKVFWATR
jgi:hypothetical protein